AGQGHRNQSLPASHVVSSSFNCFPSVIWDNFISFPCIRQAPRRPVPGKRKKPAWTAIHAGS
ncbi:MAG: hypothetical protein ACI3WQ_03895, partial [Faecousia sp.]